ncbi:MAG: DUF4384 domain-containing protein [Treponema sp.]|jgi:hypothetical protein|nr:DUF4384 domain-containing protein [Treponema sp.]
MKTKSIVRFAGLCLLTLAISLLAACASSSQKEPAYSADSLTLDAAISEAAVYFTGRLPKGAKMALVPFDAPTVRLSDYVFDEIWRRFEDSGNFVMVDRKNLERIESEIKHQYQSGKVDDALAVSMTKQYGAEILVYGQMTSLGNEYRLTVYATDVEKAQSSQRAYTIRPDNRLASLLNASLDDEVERLVQTMAKAVSQKTVIAVGRISYADTQTVSGLSAWLKNSIISGAQKQRDKFQVATDTESSDFAVATRGLTVETPAAGTNIQAVVTGSYSPLDGGAEVSMQLVSTSGNKAVLASDRFVVSASELERRRLSLFPEKGNVIITKTEFETKQQAVVPYTGANNKWAFTVTPDVLDGIYYDGDYMTMRIYSEKDCYFRIIHVDVNGETQVIYPTSASDNNFIRAGQTRRIPDNTRYRMHQPFGEEMILASAYERPFTSSQQSGTLSADSITRGMTVESDNRTQMSPSATAKFSYTILLR